MFSCPEMICSALARVLPRNHPRSRTNSSVAKEGEKSRPAPKSNGSLSFQTFSDIEPYSLVIFFGPMEWILDDPCLGIKDWTP